MALINCPKCGHVMSDKATECPNCGASATPRVQPNTPIQNGNNGSNNLNGYYNQRQDNGNDNGNSFWIYIIIFAVFAVIMVVLAITATYHKNTDQRAAADSAAVDSAAMAAPVDSTAADAAIAAAPAEPAEETTNEPDNYNTSTSTHNYRGLVDNQYPINLTLNFEENENGTNVTGQYINEKYASNTPFDLNGSMDSNNNLSVDCYLNGKRIGTFTGTLSDGVFSGHFIVGRKDLLFQVEETDNQ
jgi:predicted  nucleic acid-binding Zn-ribbon protein